MKIVALLLMTGMAGAQTHTTVTKEDAQTITATKIFTGAIICKNLQGTRCVDTVNSQGWSGSNFAAWINSAISDPGANGSTLLIAPGNYTGGATTILIDRPIVLRGSGAGNLSNGVSSTTLNFNAGVTGIKVTSANPLHWKIQDLSLKGGGGAGTDDGIRVEGGSDSVIDNVEVGSFGRNGISCDTSGGGVADFVKVRDSRSKGNGNDGFTTAAGVDCSGWIFDNDDATGNTGWGFNFVTGNRPSIIGGQNQTNTAGGIRDNVSSLFMVNHWAEGQTSLVFTASSAYAHVFLADGAYSTVTDNSVGNTNIVEQTGQQNVLYLGGSIGGLTDRYRFITTNKTPLTAQYRAIQGDGGFQLNLVDSQTNGHSYAEGNGSALCGTGARCLYDSTASQYVWVYSPAAAPALGFQIRQLVTLSSTLTLGSTVVGSLPSAASNTFAQIGVTDSSAIAAEGQNCVGGGAVKAIAISNGTAWKCF